MRRSGAVSGRVWWAINAAILLVFSFVLSSCVAIIPQPQPDPIPVPTDVGLITVRVKDGISGASVNGVVVRVTNSSVVDGIDNRELRLAACDMGQFLAISAPGYGTQFRECNGSGSYEVELVPLSTIETSNYVWSSASTDCGSCHSGQFNETYNETTEWNLSSHAKVLIDPYFMSMYRGTNVNVQNAPSREYGPGFKLDNPNSAGNCAYCHAPSVVPPTHEQVDLSSYYFLPGGAGGEGITCDICHKVAAVRFPDTKFPDPQRPGILSFQFLRLSNLFIQGPFTNVVLPDDGIRRHDASSCSPILGKSEFCAVCHYGKFDDILVYNSYGEWRESIYGRDANQPTYKTCQNCHMSHMDANNESTPLSDRSACSETTPEYQNLSHNLLNFKSDASGKLVPSMIKNAASLQVKLTYDVEHNSLKVHVEAENIKAGHKFPTDTPLRHLLLVVSVADQFGYPLPPLDGPKLPQWAGTSNDVMSANGMVGYADQAGVIYANLLVDESTNTSPAAAYWNNTHYAYVADMGQNSDTRLSPGVPQVSEYAFPLPDLGPVNVNVKLIYRYAFFDLMDQKDWVRPDVLVVTADCRMPVGQVQEMDCPEVAP